MAVVVAGGAGFIGSHLVERLIDRETVVIFDDLSSGSISHIEAPIRSGRAVFIFADIAHPDTSLETLFAKATDEPLRAVYHLASPANVQASIARPWVTLAPNGFGTMRLVELAERSDATFVYASAPDAAANAPACQSPYAVAKRFGEATTLAAATDLGVRGRIGRIFETYGPRMRTGNGIVSTLLAATTAEPQSLAIAYRAAARHGLTYVTDVVDGLLRLAMSEIDATPVDIGRDDDDSVANLVDAFRRLTRSSVPAQFGTAHETVHTIKPSTEALRRLGWSPRVSPAVGLRETLAWFQTATERYALV